MLKPIPLDGLEAATEIALSFLALPPLQRECMRYYAKGMMDAAALQGKAPVADPRDTGQPADTKTA